MLLPVKVAGGQRTSFNSSYHRILAIHFNVLNIDKIKTIKSRNLTFISQEHWFFPDNGREDIDSFLPLNLPFCVSCRI